MRGPLWHFSILVILPQFLAKIYKVFLDEKSDLKNKQERSSLWAQKNGLQKCHMVNPPSAMCMSLTCP